MFYCFDVVDQYRVFLTAALAIAVVYTTNSATNLVWADGSSMAAASAGVVLLSMINLIWIFYFGGDNSSPINQWVDSFSLKGPRNSKNPFHSSSFQRSHSSAMPNNGDNEFRHSNWSSQRYVSSTGLNGLENVSERDNTGTPIYDIPESNIGTQISVGTAASGTNLVIDDFPYTAKALYSYEASSDDENEISFEKGEILKVNDIHSRWWQAKRSNGEIGICPSNYVELIE
jgi:SHO1 osmosensor